MIFDTNNANTKTDLIEITDLSLIDQLCLLDNGSINYINLNNITYSEGDSYYLLVSVKSNLNNYLFKNYFYKKRHLFNTL